MRTLYKIVISCLLAVVWVAGGHAAEPQPGREFTPVEPQAGARAASAAGKIEVIEFFSYGCPHCNDFQPLVKRWEAQLPKDVVFRQIPVSFGRPAWARLARTYYALQDTGNLNALNEKMFSAIHNERASFNTDDAVVGWAAGKGANGPKLAEALASFDVQTRLQKGDQEASGYRIGGVPALVVDGRYSVRNEAVGGYDELLKLTDTLIAKARADKRRADKPKK